MRAVIHRGAHEIGGSCVEVEARGERIILDLGRPLSAGRDEVVALPDIAGLDQDDTSLLGVIITHAHQDHWGLAGQIAPGVELFLGEATSRILAEAAFWTSGLTVAPAGFLAHRQRFALGRFTITAFLNDHSAFDAYSLLIEADGARLFYTGDICGHGRKAALFEQLLRQPPPDVDVLLMERTNIAAEGYSTRSAPSETDVETAMAATMKETEGMVLVVSSAQNIDRLVTIYRAALRAGRELVVDLYGASIARATANPNIPQPGKGWPKLHVYVPRWQRVKVKEAGEFARVGAVRAHRVYEEYLAENAQRLVMMFNVGSGPALVKAGCLSGASAIWSLWPGYLKEDSGRRLVAFLAAQGIPMVKHHASGHASPADLERLAHAINPKTLIPIHSFAGHRFSELFDNVTVQPDGKWWQV
ncbi:MAG: MBL fold metallo-hydrolase [Acidimicrobiales bacterium]